MNSVSLDKTLWTNNRFSTFHNYAKDAKSMHKTVVEDWPPMALGVSLSTSKRRLQSLCRATLGTFDQRCSRKWARHGLRGQRLALPPKAIFLNSDPETSHRTAERHSAKGIMEQDRSTTIVAFPHRVRLSSLFASDMSGESESGGCGLMFARGEWEGDGRPDELCSGSSASSTSDATTARWYEACKTRVAASQSTRRSEWSSPSETKPRPRGSGRSGADPTHEGITAAFVPSVEAWAVTFLPRTQETPAMLKAGMLAASTQRVRGRMAGQCPTAGKRLVDSVTGDQSAGSHLETDIDVRVTSQPCFSWREAGANALASRAQETPRE